MKKKETQQLTHNFCQTLSCQERLGTFCQTEGILRTFCLTKRRLGTFYLIKGRLGTFCLTKGRLGTFSWEKENWAPPGATYHMILGQANERPHIQLHGVGTTFNKVTDVVTSRLTWPRGPSVWNLAYWRHWLYPLVWIIAPILKPQKSYYF